jgi:hypothetical protein
MRRAAVRDATRRGARARLRLRPRSPPAAVAGIRRGRAAAPSTLTTTTGAAALVNVEKLGISSALRLPVKLLSRSLRKMVRAYQ